MALCRLQSYYFNMQLLHFSNFHVQPLNKPVSSSTWKDMADGVTGDQLSDFWRHKFNCIITKRQMIGARNPDLLISCAFGLERWAKTWVKMAKKKKMKQPALYSVMQYSAGRPARGNYSWICTLARGCALKCWKMLKTFFIYYRGWIQSRLAALRPKI